MTQEENAKLDEILEQNRSLFTLLNGERGHLGLLAKVEIMWAGHVWALCTLSAAAGSGLTALVIHFMR